MVDYIKNKTQKYQMVLFVALISSMILMGIFYIYSISSIVMETVQRNQNFQNLQVVQRQYQELEESYLSLISKFNLDYAYSLGFVNENNSLAYISRQNPVAQNNSYEEAVR